MAMLTEALGRENSAQVLRVMPNTPALVGAGYTAICEEHTFNKAALAWAKELFSTLGMVQVLPERLFDAVVAVSGSSPLRLHVYRCHGRRCGAAGYAQKNGHPGSRAGGSGLRKMVLDTGEHPDALKDNVCSPGGTTIEAVHALEKNGFRGIVMEAMDACARKNRKMSTPLDRRGKL